MVDGYVMGTWRDRLAPLRAGDALVDVDVARQSTTAFEDGAGDNPAWTTLTEQQTWLTALAAESDRVEFDQVGTSSADRRIDLVRVGHPTPASYANLDRVLLILNLQHGTEPPGREASFQLVRDLAFTTDPAVVGYLTGHTVCVVPAANPDGFATDTRNIPSPNVDLNRQHINLTVDEAEIIQTLIRDLRPVLVLDTHEDTAVASGVVELLWPTSPQVDSQLAGMAQELAEGVLMPALTSHGYGTGQYPGGTDERILRNTAGLRHGLAVLFESDSGDTSRRARTRSHEILVRAGVEYHRSRDVDLEAMCDGAASRKTTEGTEATEAFDFANGTVVDPQPSGYTLTSAQHDTVTVHRGIFDIASTPDGADFSVSMGQEAQPVIPYLMDGRATNNEVAATPDGGGA